MVLDPTGGKKKKISFCIVFDIFINKQINKKNIRIFYLKQKKNNIYLRTIIF